MPGKTVLEQPREVGRGLDLVDERPSPEPAITSPYSPRPMPQASAVGRPFPNGAAGRPAEPDEGARQARRRDRARGPEVAPHERLDADDEEQDDATSATGSATASRSAPASGRWFDVQPNQVRFASGASAGTAPW